jgi:predicted RNase H-like HicB family nuclease
MIMEIEKAKLFFEAALDYSNKYYSEDLVWVRTRSIETFKKMTSEQFLYQYCWVVYVSGFRASVIENKFDALSKVFENFNIEKLYHLESIEPALAIIKNERKAKSFLKGVKLIYEEGFPQFKERVLNRGMSALKELPGIGEITQKHLARNIGIQDIGKDDVWLVRLTDKFKARNVEDLIIYLADEFSEKKGVVDLILWRFCVDNAWQGLGFSTLDDFLASLGRNIRITTHIFTAVIHREDSLYVAQCPEIGTISQGETIEEAIANLKEATELYLEEFPVPEVDRPILTTFEATVYA